MTRKDLPFQGVTHRSLLVASQDGFTGCLQFYCKNAQIILPFHLEANVQNTLAELASTKGVGLSVFVNDLLKKDIELIQMTQ